MTRPLCAYPNVARYKGSGDPTCFQFSVRRFEVKDTSSAESRPWIDGLTIGQVLAESARRFPHREAIVFRQAAVRMTYLEFATAVADAAKGLIALGVKPGEHVGIWERTFPNGFCCNMPRRASASYSSRSILHTGLWNFTTQSDKATSLHCFLQIGLRRPITTRFLRRSAPRSPLRRADASTRRRFRTAVRRCDQGRCARRVSPIGRTMTAARQSDSGSRIGCDCPDVESIRRDQYPIHIGHDRLSEGGHARRIATFS